MTRDHLRVCGADVLRSYQTVMQLGSPPRVRSRLHDISQQLPYIGITSACAEQTSPKVSKNAVMEDHLRVCGADFVHFSTPAAPWGSPPRVRSRRLWRSRSWLSAGITSACAEQTKRRVEWHHQCRDHLRVCGADRLAYTGLIVAAGSPPRVRSRPVSSLAAICFAGITSACAEQTPKHPDRYPAVRDHLRVCGADL